MLLIDYLRRQYLAMIQTNPVKYVNYLKKKGCQIGARVYIYDGYIDMALLPLITIGNDVTLTGTSILAHDASTQIPLGRTKVAKVIIGDNVFAGMGSIILPGSTIGNNVIIGAGTIVRGEIPDNSVIVGNPWKIACSRDDFIMKYQGVINQSEIYNNKNHKDIIRMRDDIQDIAWIR